MSGPRAGTALEKRGGSGLRARYGPWAVVAGASEGLGAAFARQLAAAGLDLVLIARREAELTALCDELASSHGVRAEPLVLDLASPDLAERAGAALAGREVGLLVYNAALSAIGDFFATPLERHLAILDVNCRGPLVLAHLLGEPMRARGRGGIVLMASMAGFQGTALLASYAATKAFNRVLGESLWDELRRGGVEVVVSNAGATRTPRYLATEPRRGRVAAPEMEPQAVVAATLRGLRRGGSLVPGWSNRLAALLMQRVLPRRWAVKIMGRAMRKLYPQV